MCSVMEPQVKLPHPSTSAGCIWIDWVFFIFYDETETCWFNRIQYDRARKSHTTTTLKASGDFRIKAFVLTPQHVWLREPSSFCSNNGQILINANYQALTLTTRDPEESCWTCYRPSQDWILIQWFWVIHAEATSLHQSVSRPSLNHAETVCLTLRN